MRVTTCVIWADSHVTLLKIKNIYTIVHEYSIIYNKLDRHESLNRLNGTITNCII